MARGGRAWRGYFPVGGELTSGKPDQKEGLYFGAELADDHPRVAARHAAARPRTSSRRRARASRGRARVHGRADALGHALMEGVALSLGLDESLLRRRATRRDPLMLFRIFHYPPSRRRPTTELGRRRAHRLRPA